MTDIVIAEAVRSRGRPRPQGLARARSAPTSSPRDVIRGLLARVPAGQAGKIDDVVLGCAMPEGEQGLNVARLIALLADLGRSRSPAQTINRFCSSGLQAIAIAAGAIAVGSNDVVLAGGVESMTLVPMTGNKLSASPELMEQAARREHADGHHRRERREAVRHHAPAAGRVRAHESQKKAKAALEKGVFKDEIVPVRARRATTDGERVYKDFTVDELPRADTTLEGLAQAPPAFAQGGSVTAGQQLAALRRRGGGARDDARRRPTSSASSRSAYFRAFVTVGVDPEIMGIGPLPAVQKLLAKNGLKIDGHRPVRDERGVREPGGLLPARARHPRRQAQRQRRRDRARSPARLHRREAHGDRALRAAAAAAAATPIVTMCIGGGLGAAGLFEAVR